jgi:hypothetical protein
VSVYPPLTSSFILILFYFNIVQLFRNSVYSASYSKWIPIKCMKCKHIASKVSTSGVHTSSTIRLHQSDCHFSKRRSQWFSELWSCLVGYRTVVVAKQYDYFHRFSSSPCYISNPHTVICSRGQYNSSLVAHVSGGWVLSWSQCLVPRHLIWEFFLS